MNRLTTLPIIAAVALVSFGCSPAPQEVWSTPETTRASEAMPSAHGYFQSRPATVITSALPEHKMVRVKFKLIIKGGWDGNNGVWGPDLIGCRVRGGEQLFLTSFSNLGANSICYTQSFPDDFPWANHYAFTGATPLSGKPFETPVPYYEAAIADSVYDLDMTFPHRGDTLTLDFSAMFTDPHTDNQYWAIADYSCAATSDPVALDEPTLKTLWSDMAADDSTKAVAALWRFVAAGDTAAGFLIEKSKDLNHNTCCGNIPPYNTPNGMRLNRLQRALRLIATPASLAEGDAMSHKAPPRHTCGEEVSR